MQSLNVSKDAKQSMRLLTSTSNLRFRSLRFRIGWSGRVLCSMPVKAVDSSSLQWRSGCLDMHSPWAFSNTFKEKVQSFLDCSPRTRGQGGLHGLECAPSPPARLTARNPGRSGRISVCAK